LINPLITLITYHTLALVGALVVAETKEGGVAEQTIRGDVGVLHLAHVMRLDPRRSGRLGDALTRQRVGARRDGHAVTGGVAPQVG